jgi:hypothetical protein
VSRHDAWLHSPDPRHYREMTCAEYGYSWESLGHIEYGVWLPERDDDLKCPECGGEAE